MRGFAQNSQQYGSTNAKLDHFVWMENSWGPGGILFGGEGAANDLTVKNNYGYGAGIRIGYNGDGNKTALVVGNYVDGIQFQEWTDMRVFNNTFFNTNNRLTMLADTPDTYDYSTNQMDYNTVYSTRVLNGKPVAFSGPRLSSMTLEEWRAATGYEMNGTVVRQALPTQNKAVVLKNQFDPTLATVMIYNWEELSSVAVDLGDFLAAGDQYEIRQLYDYYNDRSAAVYSGGLVNFAMTNRTVALPLGWATALMSNTFPKFGMFIVKIVD